LKIFEIELPLIKDLLAEENIKGIETKSLRGLLIDFQNLGFGRFG
jgi:hypothetical protein